MKLNYTYIAEVLDRSGSMGSIAAKTREGHNEFLRGQKTAPGECSYLLTQFDNEYETIYDGPIARAPELTELNYVPRGSTALLDAIGDTVMGLGTKLAGLPEAERPERVVVVILTDGQENASQKYSRKEVFDMITHQRTAYGWTFLFLGANQDAIHEGAKFGIPMQFAANYAASNVTGGYQNMSHKVEVMRGMSGASTAMVASVMSFSDEERKDLEEEK